MAHTTFVVEGNAIRVPDWIRDLASFRRWVHSDQVPEKLQTHFFRGQVWIDLSREQIFSHNQVKGAYHSVLHQLSKFNRLGYYIPNGMLLSNAGADFACQPDAMFATYESFRTGKIRLLENVQPGSDELEGTPDMVLEVVSTSSIEKDTVTFRDLYWQAGIQEYWLVDARGERVVFDILRHSPKGYVSTKKQAGGWVKSNVFGKSFRLTCQDGRDGNPEYTLEVR